MTAKMFGSAAIGHVTTRQISKSETRDGTNSKRLKVDRLRPQRNIDTTARKHKMSTVVTS